MVTNWRSCASRCLLFSRLLCTSFQSRGLAVLGLKGVFALRRYFELPVRSGKFFNMKRQNKRTFAIIKMQQAQCSIILTDFFVGFHFLQELVCCDDIADPARYFHFPGRADFLVQTWVVNHPRNLLFPSRLCVQPLINTCMLHARCCGQGLMSDTSFHVGVMSSTPREEHITVEKIQIQAGSHPTLLQQVQAILFSHLGYRSTSNSYPKMQLDWQKMKPGSISRSETIRNVMPIKSNLLKGWISANI